MLGCNTYMEFSDYVTVVWLWPGKRWFARPLSTTTALHFPMRFLTYEKSEKRSKGAFAPVYVGEEG